MVYVENIIVKGKYFVPAKSEQIPALKSALQTYLAVAGYLPEVIAQGRTFFGESRFLTANYYIPLSSREVPWKLKLRRLLHLITEDAIKKEQYNIGLGSTRREVPCGIRLRFSLQTINNVDGIVIDVTSVPVAYYQISQLNRNLYLDRADYGMIKYENTEFIEEIMASIHAQTLSEPKLLSDYIKNDISEKLRVYKFTKVAECLDNGRKKLEMGEDAYDDLIGVIEIFLFDLVNRLDTTPAGRHNPEKNIDKLKRLGFLSDKTEGIVQSSLFHSVYLKLKDIQHKKEHLDYFDASLYYGITESIVDYLLETVVKYRVKYEQNEEK